MLQCTKMVLYTTEDLNFSNLFRVDVTAAAAATTIVVSANALAFVVDIFFFIWPTPSKVASKLTLCFLYILCRFLFYGNSHFTRKQSEQRMRERKRKRKTTFQSQHSLCTCRWRPLKVFCSMYVLQFNAKSSG